MSTRVTASRIVGREPELAELEAALADASQGRPSLAFLAGESGVGKSRLLGAFADRARAGGARVLSGDCVELGEGELPYAPIVGALRPLVRAEDPVLEALAPADRAALARLLPGMGDGGGAGGRDDEAAAQSRLFEALLALLELMGRDRPVVLAIEDLHWADRSTRAFVSFLSRSLCAERVLVLASYRPDELHRRHPLRPLLAELERDVRARRIALEALSREQLAELLGDIVGDAPDPPLVERLWSRAAGNPLFTEELLAAGLDGRGAPPATLRDALMVRVERLGEASVELLRLLAAGQRLDHDLLAESSGLDPAALRAALREAVAGHIVVADADGAYAFRHALLREVVNDDLLPGEHAELHRTLAAALERRIGAGGEAGAHLTAAAAHHHHAAGDRPAALVASLRAAAAAERVHAHGEALALLERALELWPQVERAGELAGADRAEILVRAAQAAELHGEPARGEALLNAALGEIDPTAAPRRAAQVLERLARSLRRLARGDDALEAVRRGLALLPAGEGSQERARLLSQEAKIRMLAGRFREGVDVSEAALAAARASGDRVAQATTLNALGVCLMETGDVEGGIAALEEARDIARADDRPADLADAFNNLADVLHIQGRGREALAAAREGLAQPQLTWHAAEWLETMLAEIAIDLGEWTMAEAHLPPVGRRRTSGAVANIALRRAELALGRGDHALAREQLDSIAVLADGWTEPQFQAPYGTLRAELLRREGDLDAARAAIDEALDQIEFCTEDVMRLARVAATGVAVEADAAERARDLGDIDAVAGAQDRLAALLERVDVTAGTDRPVEAAVLASARVDAARAAGAPDPGIAAGAAAAWLAIGRPYPAAVLRRREAEAHLARGDRDAATVALRAARQTAAGLGAGWLAEQVEGLAARARLHLEEAPAAAADPGLEAELPFGLTPREHQVLVLVARGSTNREVGAALYMAEKTASVHVSRILAKLGVRSRTEAAAVAHRLGLDHALV